VEVCLLKKDLEMLSFGINTLVGEKGISGGQRDRICIARALFSDTDIFLFDESLVQSTVQLARLF
jgi:ABC-type multidrug transport system fused ATPase/permease subunit